MSNIPASAARVAAAARTAGLDIKIVEMAQTTRTAEEAAQACGCTSDQIVKSLVFIGRDTGSPYLLLVSGLNRVDENGIASAIGEKLQRPDARAVRELTGFAIGGIPPIGLATPMPAVIDTRLLDFKTVWAAAGTPRCVFAVDPRALQMAISARPASF